MTAVLDPQSTPVGGVRAGAFGNATHLICRECGHQTALGAYYACLECFGPLEVGYAFPQVTREQLESGPRSIWRYAPLLPVPADIASFRSTDPGFTRLVDARNLARELGLETLWIKDDSGNPTHSFKDRVVAVALAAARELGLRVLACPSTGNLANAVAAAAARAGIKSVVFIPHDLERPKVLTTAVYGGTLVAVKGNYDDVNRLASEIAGEEDGWAFVNVNVRPYYAEGSKTLAFEVAEQLGWRSPDAMVIPAASGSLYTKVGKGLRELHKVGLLDEAPGTALHGAQAEGCSPIATAFANGSEDVRPVKPNTVAKSIAIGNPADGYYALKEAKATSGTIVSVPEDSVADGMRLLARTEGIFTETAGGVTIAALERLVSTRTLSPDQETVALITGMGLKTLEALG